MTPDMYTNRAKTQLEFIKEKTRSITDDDIKDLENTIKDAPTIILTGEVYVFNGIKYNELYRSKTLIISSEIVYNKSLIFYYINLGDKIKITYIENKAIRIRE